MKKRNYIKLEKDFLYNEYIVKGKTLTQIGKEIDCSWSKIHEWIKRYNIPLRKPMTGKELCAKHGHTTRFKNGHETFNINPPRGEKSKTSIMTEHEAILSGRITQWTDYKEWSQRIIQERGNYCEHCLKHQNELKHKIFLHHIKPRKTHPELCFEETNTMVVCRICHPKLEYTGKKNYER